MQPPREMCWKGPSDETQPMFCGTDIRDCVACPMSWTPELGHKDGCRLRDGEGEEKKVCVGHRGADEADIPTTLQGSQQH